MPLTFQVPLFLFGSFVAGFTLLLCTDARPIPTVCDAGAVHQLAQTQPSARHCLAETLAHQSLSDQAAAVRPWVVAPPTHSGHAASHAPAQLMSSGQRRMRRLATGNVGEVMPAAQLRVAVIHHKPLVSRRERLARRLKDVGIPADSVLWLDMFPRAELTESKEKCLFGAGEGDSHGADANTWSQYALYAEMVRQEWPLVLVLEDDISWPSLSTQEAGAFWRKISSCAHDLRTEHHLDVLHVGDVDSAYVVTLEGAHKLLAEMSTIPGSAPGTLQRGGNDINLVHLEHHADRKSRLLQRGCAPLVAFSVVSSVAVNTEHGSHKDSLAEHVRGNPYESVPGLPSQCPPLYEGSSDGYSYVLDTLAARAATAIAQAEAFERELAVAAAAKAHGSA